MNPNSKEELQSRAKEGYYLAGIGWILIGIIVFMEIQDIATGNSLLVQFLFHDLWHHITIPFLLLCDLAGLFGSWFLAWIGLPFLILGSRMRKKALAALKQMEDK